MRTTSGSSRAGVEAQLIHGTLHYAPPAHPAEMEFAEWLEARRPPGAPTLLVAPPGARAALELPSLREPALSPPRRRSRRRRGTAPAVHSAFLVDVEGLSPRQVAEGRVLPASNERAVRQLVRDGRFVASELGVWPWAVVGGQPLPRNWWVDEPFALALEEWALEHLPKLSVRRLPPPAPAGHAVAGRVRRRGPAPSVLRLIVPLSLPCPGRGPAACRTHKVIPGKSSL